MKHLKGNLTISRTRSNTDNPRPIRIEITDVLSRCRVAEVELSLEDFALAVTGMGCVDCEFDWSDAAPIGKRREYKTVEVELPDRWDVTDEQVRFAVAEHEVDGWLGRDGDCRNGHNRVRGKGDGSRCRVVYERWVDAEG